MGVSVMRGNMPKFLQAIVSENAAGGETVEGKENEEPQDDVDEEPEGEEDPGDDDSGENDLGDPGKRALDRMKDKWKAERDKRKALEAKYGPVEKVEADGSARFKQKILRSEIKAAAADLLNDPADAYRFLDVEQFDVSEDGDVDEDEIAAAITDLLEKKPYLAKTQGERRRKGSANGGYRKDSTPTQLTRADLARMTPAQILRAEKEGRLTKLKGL